MSPRPGRRPPPGRSRLGGAILTGALLALLGTLAFAASASARPWTTTYDWDGADAGYEGWRGEESPAGDGQPGPFYRLSRGGPPRGPGLAVAPLGGRVYGNGDPSRPDGGPSGRLALDAPGASTIERAAYRRARFRNESDGQVFRLRVGSGSAGQTRDYFPGNGYPPDVEHRLGTVTLTTTAAARRTEIGLLTTCPGEVEPQTPPHRCPTIAADTPTFGQTGAVELTFDDPDQPGLEVTSDPPAGEDAYERRPRPRTLMARATDASSGVRRLRVELSVGGGPRRTLEDRTVECDPEHRTPDRGALECPPTAQVTARDPGTDGGSSRREYTITATDRAGNETSRTITVRRDLIAPSSARLSGEITRLAGAWTNRRGPIGARLTGTDSLSGVARLRLQARRDGTGRPVDLADLRPPCTGAACRRVAADLSADLDAIDRDGRYRLQIEATDRAGNQRTFRIAGRDGLLRIDRVAPAPPAGEVRRIGGVFYALLSAGRDPSTSSGLRDFVIAYPRRGAGPGQARVRIATAPEETTSRGRFRRVRLDDYDEDAEGLVRGANDDQAGNESEVAVVRRAPRARRCQYRRFRSPKIRRTGRSVRGSFTARCFPERKGVISVCVREDRRGARDRNVRCSRSSPLFAGRRTVRIRATCRTGQRIYVQGYLAANTAGRGLQNAAPTTRRVRCPRSSTARGPGRRTCRSPGRRTRDRSGRKYMVYLGKIGGRVRYVGSTSNFARRCGEHRRGRRKNIYPNFVTFSALRYLTRYEAQTIEQVVMNKFGHARSSLNENYDRPNTRPRVGVLVNGRNEFGARGDAGKRRYCAAVKTGRRLLRRSVVYAGYTFRPRMRRRNC